MGKEVLRVVEQYKYLGLWYHYSLKWHVHAREVMKKAHASSALIFRIIQRSSPPTVRTIRALVLSFLLPAISYGCPFWKPCPSEFNAILSLTCAPLLRVLLLPTSTHRLSVLAECGVPPIRVLWEKLTLSFAIRLRKLPLAHPCSVLFAAQSPTNRHHAFRSSLAAVERKWNLSVSSLTRHSLRRAAGVEQNREWRAAGCCRDLLALRPPNQHGMAPYLRRDPFAVCALRARLRLNRSSLHSSLRRRHARLDSICPCCGAVEETTSHLLVCPAYAASRTALPPSFALFSAWRAPRVPFSLAHLLGEVHSLPRSERASALSAGGQFLLAVRDTRPNGL
jgi:hypothetical protein